jgi:RHS repeat-associated protein
VVRKGAGTGGTIHYFHRNQQYSITAVTTSAGAIAERYAYSAYGEPTILDGSGSQISNSSINNRYSYTGREWDATVGLHHFRAFRARWMSPKSGRFLGRDPIGYKGSPYDLYEYCESNSIARVDPDGTIAVPIVAAVAVTAVMACMTSALMEAEYYFQDNEYQRHCYASCVGAKRCGPEISSLTGIGFEAVNLAYAAYVGGLREVNRHLPNSIYDIINNQIGIACSQPQLRLLPSRCVVDLALWVGGWGCSDCCARFKR